ncbi:50S ribosomal protein L18 [Spiroplasma endosymbiont of Polydrusus pterygomalis]|uniref:50S ribosomal protein L18 n=1 Tax=Spiroplasma endosymbiont of Polydrusus pterygomalis TaxID=3139327 RepID=UPI003CCB01DC
MIKKQQARKVRHYRIRSKITGTSERPRLNIFKSNNSFYAQIIDDTASNTIIGISTLTFKDLTSTSNIEAAIKLGETIANLASKKKIKKVVFDRGGYLYHGKVKAFAQAARSAGLEF